MLRRVLLLLPLLPALALATEPSGPVLKLSHRRSSRPAIIYAKAKPATITTNTQQQSQSQRHAPLTKQSSSRSGEDASLSLTTNHPGTFFISSEEGNPLHLSQSQPPKVNSSHHHTHHNPSSGEVDEGDASHYPFFGGFLKREIWTIPLFVFALLNLSLISFFEIFVLCRTKGGKGGRRRGGLFLGQVLLLGLFLSSSLALLFALYPNMVTCYASRLGLGFCYALLFSVLLVKAVFLLCLDLGVYLPQTYQAILLFFAVLVQVVMDSQWVLIFPPTFLQGEEVEGGEGEGLNLFLRCGSSYGLLLYSMWYVAFLLSLAGFLAAKATLRGISENFHEAKYILMSLILSVPIGIGWVLAGYILEGKEQEAAVGFGLLAHSLTIFLVMFMPKGRQLAAMGKEILGEDEDNFSRYSPSFFHFRPAKSGGGGGYKGGAAVFGDGNLYTTLEPTMSTINPNVFFHRGGSDYHSGMIY